MTFKPVGSGLHALLARWVADPQAKMAILVDGWQRSVGEAVSQHTEPVRFVDGELFVRVTDPNWRLPLESMCEELRDKLNSYLGGDTICRINWE